MLMVPGERTIELLDIDKRVLLVNYNYQCYQCSLSVLLSMKTILRDLCEIWNLYMKIITKVC